MSSASQPASDVTASTTAPIPDGTMQVWNLNQDFRTQAMLSMDLDEEEVKVIEAIRKRRHDAQWTKNIDTAPKVEPTVETKNEDMPDALEETKLEDVEVKSEIPDHDNWKAYTNEHDRWLGSSSRSYCGSKPYDESKPDWTEGGLDGDTPDGSGDEQKEFVADTKMYATKEEYQQMLDNKEKYKHLMPTPTWSDGSSGQFSLPSPDDKDKYKHLTPKSPERKSNTWPERKINPRYVESWKWDSTNDGRSLRAGKTTTKTSSSVPLPPSEDSWAPSAAFKMPPPPPPLPEGGFPKAALPRPCGAASSTDAVFPRPCGSASSGSERSYVLVGGEPKDIDSDGNLVLGFREKEWLLTVDWETTAPERTDRDKGKTGKDAIEDYVLHKDVNDPSKWGCTRRCHECGTMHHWRNMERRQNPHFTQESQLSQHMDDKDKLRKLQEQHYVLMGTGIDARWIFCCIPCICTRLNCTVGQATTITKVPLVKSAKSRQESFNEASRRVNEGVVFAKLAAGAEPSDNKRDEKGRLIVEVSSNKEGKRRKMEMIREESQSMRTFFMPIARLIALKLGDELKFQEALEEYMQVLQSGDSSAPHQRVLNKTEDMLTAAMGNWRAFAAKCTDASGQLDVALQNKFANVADYEDEWFRNFIPKAGADDCFRTYYICKAGGDNPCNTIILAKHWSRMKDDPSSSGQRWYCQYCCSKYNAKFGLLIELIMQGEPRYVRAALPPQGAQDIKLMAVEMKMAKEKKTYNTPMELYNHIPDAIPLGAGTTMIKRTRSMCKGDDLKNPYPAIDGHYALDGANLDDIPKWDFMEIFNFAEAAIENVPSKLAKRLGMKEDGSCTNTNVQ